MFVRERTHRSNAKETTFEGGEVVVGSVGGGCDGECSGEGQYKKKKLYGRVKGGII